MHYCVTTDVCLCFFFFKQKTAYEMRISDWSSDVCSSDLQARQRVEAVVRRGRCATNREKEGPPIAIRFYGRRPAHPFHAAPRAQQPLKTRVSAQHSRRAQKKRAGTCVPAQPFRPSPPETFDPKNTLLMSC